jgi:prepilin-type N-terminal cleavage/methylation domain-containing protein
MEMPRQGGAAGFTLIELSIVLVIIGLIVGGVLTGQDLIRAAEVRATISQIEKYNTAVNTFYGKYDALPGNMNATTAATFGFSTVGRTGAVGFGSGNGVITGDEELMFWVDLSSPIAGGLIDGSFTAGAGYTDDNELVALGGLKVALYLPPAKLGRGNYIWTWSGGWQAYASPPGDGQNYFSLSTPATLGGSSTPHVPSTTLTVTQAYSIDKKMDDGMPQSGNVMAIADGGYGLPIWAAGGGNRGAADPTTAGPVVAGDGVSTSPSAATCYDNGGTAGATEQYSLSTNSGAGPNCALGFKFQ